MQQRQDLLKPFAIQAKGRRNLPFYVKRFFCATFYLIKDLFGDFCSERNIIVTKHFRLVIDLKVDIKESVERGVRRRRLVEAFVKQFLADDEAVLRFFRLWLKDEFRAGDLGEKISDCFPRELDTDILRPVIEACSPRVRKHFLKALITEENQGHNESESDWEKFFEQVGFFDVDGVTLTMVGEGKDNG